MSYIYLMTSDDKDIGSAAKCNNAQGNKRKNNNNKEDK